jgi:Chaperone of endosialidase
LSLLANWLDKLTRFFPNSAPSGTGVRAGSFFSRQLSRLSDLQSKGQPAATTGSENTAIGWGAGDTITTGDSNTCLGVFSCFNTSSADNVVCIGADAFGENFSNRAYIPNIGQFAQGPAPGTIEFVTVRLSDGKLGHDVSARRYKEDIKPMGDASELLYKLKPVTYRFKETDVDPEKGPPPQNLDYGLIAEDVAEIDPQLAIRDGKGQIESVRYKAIYNMMLNEFLKEHRTVQEQKETIAQLKQNFAEQQKQIDALTAGLQKVSAQVEMRKPASQMVLNNQ